MPQVQPGGYDRKGVRGGEETDDRGEEEGRDGGIATECDEAYYIAKTLMAVAGKDAPMALGSRRMEAQSKDGSVYVRIERTDGAEVVPCSPCVVYAKTFARSSDNGRYAELEVSPDGTWHSVGPLRVEHRPCPPGRFEPPPSPVWGCRMASHADDIRRFLGVVPAATLKAIGEGSPSERFPYAYLRTDGFTCCMGLPGTAMLRCKGAAPRPCYTTVDVASLAKAVPYMRGEVEISFADKGPAEMAWTRKGIRTTMQMAGDDVGTSLERARMRGVIIESRRNGNCSRI